MDEVIFIENQLYTWQQLVNWKLFWLGKIDTKGQMPKYDYLQELDSSAVKKSENKFGCKVGSFVTDSLHAQDEN